MWDLEDDDDYDREALSALGEEGCLFPDECCMPGIHYTSECHRAEDYEALAQEKLTSNTELCGARSASERAPGSALQPQEI